METLLSYIPLGILGFVRWVSWVIRQVPATFYRPVVNDHFEPLTVVVPVYQEEPRLFRAALMSWLANKVHEIICVIDYTDTRSIEIAKELGVTVLVTKVPGKRDALRRGWEAASTPLVALVDSDTVWAPDVAELVAMPFADPEVGAVTARQNVKDPRTPWQHLNDMYLDYRYFHELASQSVVGRAVSCLSGRTAIYRRSLLLAHSHAFMNETFWGVPCLSGDDKRLTMLVLEGGHSAVLQRSACVWSQFPTGPSAFFKQRLRWARNTWRSDLRALSSDWLWRRKFLAYWMLDKAVSSFTLLVSPVYLTFALIERHFLVAGILGAWWMFSRSAKLLAHLERKPSHFFTMMPFFILISFAMAMVKVGALLTIRKQRWLTRDVEVSAKSKTVVRTDDGAEDAASSTERDSSEVANAAAAAGGGRKVSSVHVPFDAKSVPVPLDAKSVPVPLDAKTAAKAKASANAKAAANAKVQALPPVRKAPPAGKPPAGGAAPEDKAAPKDQTRSVSEVSPADQAAPQRVAEPTDKAAPTDKAVPADRGVPADKAAANGQATPADKAAANGQATPADKAAANGQATPADKAAPTDHAASADKAVPKGPALPTDQAAQAAVPTDHGARNGKQAPAGQAQQRVSAGRSAR